MIELEHLRDIVAELTSRPRHEKVRTLIYNLLVHGLGAKSTEVHFEYHAPEVRGFIDALLGRTIFEFKSDLRQEIKDAEAGLIRYISERESDTGEHFIGIATDGATFVSYELRNGSLTELARYLPSAERPNELLVWLSAAVAISNELEPTPYVVRTELGGDSIAWRVAHGHLVSLWSEVRQKPDVQLKRQLWASLLERIYGAPVNQDTLFFQHTYLVIVAKTIAVHALDLGMPTNAADLLAGRPFQEAGVTGVVESDFFDWVLEADGGNRLVKQIAQQAGRFRLRDVQTDVLKQLYESLIDPAQRHDLGEYYTPDWLAARICSSVIDSPLQQRVLDPACGSGTFVFHAVRRFLSAADAAGLSNTETLAECTNSVFGIDVHPVATQIARVTYLLALGEARLTDTDRPSHLTIPVYLGDSLQWNTQGLLAEQEVLIEVPDGPVLQFPYAIAREPALFDSVITQMLAFSEHNAPQSALRAWLTNQDNPFDAASKETLAATYEMLRQLSQDGRNHIWGFVARNTVRPTWLSQESQRVDIIVGNPPWLTYNKMNAHIQEQFREGSKRYGVWVGSVAQQQDLCAYFFARCSSLYLNASGRIAFVMPGSVMTRKHFSKFRTGFFGVRSGKTIKEIHSLIHFTECWDLSDVSPVFTVASCVLFGERISDSNDSFNLPSSVVRATGHLSRKDASYEESESNLAWEEVPWPAQHVTSPTEGYGKHFRSGSPVFPSVLFRVNLVPLSRIGVDPNAPVVESVKSTQPAWRQVDQFRGQIESEFIRNLYLGASIVPYRVISHQLAIIPWDEHEEEVLTSAKALTKGYIHLAEWLNQISARMSEKYNNRRNVEQQLNHIHQLDAQFPIPPVRVAYSASGHRTAAALINDSHGIVEHKAYWAHVNTAGEGLYLLGMLNSDTVHSLAKQFYGAWDIDKAILKVNIPEYDADNPLHNDLAEIASQATSVASQVPVEQATRIGDKRRMVRNELLESGITSKLEQVVRDILG